MAAEAAAGPMQGKLVVRNIGLLLSGDSKQPILDADTVVAVVLLQSGMFKESYPGYPADRLG